MNNTESIRYAVKSLTMFLMSSLLIFQTGCAGNTPSVTNQVVVHTFTASPTEKVEPTISPVPQKSLSTNIPPTPEKPSPVSSGSSTTMEVKRGTLQLKLIETNPNQAKFDLDLEKMVGNDDPTADIEYYRDQGSGMVVYYITVINNAKSGFSLLYGGQIRKHEDCLKYLSKLVGPLSLPDVIYKYQSEPICVLTNQKRLALLTFQRDNEVSVEFEYVISIDPISTK